MGLVFSLDVLRLNVGLINYFEYDIILSESEVLTMKIKIEIEIENCYECPFAKEVREMGYCATDCSQLGCYSTIPDRGVRKDCPFKNNT